MKYVRVIPREITGGTANYDNQRASAMGLTYQLEIKESLFSDSGPKAPSIREALGIVETYVCFKCGFVEWYCRNPAEIPIGQEYNSDIIDYASDQPYR
jgi:hypothetical protein